MILLVFTSLHTVRTLRSIQSGQVLWLQNFVFRNCRCPAQSSPSACLFYVQSCPGTLLTLLFQTESASQFVKGERPDLAEKEASEAKIISAFLPPMLSEAEIDRVLEEVASSCPRDGNPKKVLGLIFKSFYSKIDKTNVDPDLVKSRAEVLLNL